MTRSRDILLFLCGVLIPALLGEPAIAGGVRYRDEIFPSYQRLADVQYGQASGITLLLDIYTGTSDTVTNRPVALFIHGGGFQNGDKSTPYAKIVCGGLAKRGYVAASINYRLSSTIAGDTAYFDAMLRALQDAKAAVRFVRKNRLLYGIDTSHIFAIGSSAGAITALHLAYLDSSEVPSSVDWSSVGMTFEGTSGNAGYSSHVDAVVSNWGAIGDTAWMHRNDPPVYCLHGTADSTVYYNLIPAYGPFLYSSKYIIMAAQQKGIPNGLRLFVGSGHELNGDTTKLDSAYTDFSAWLYTFLESSASSVSDPGHSTPEASVLLQNYPNPFNPSTKIQFSIVNRQLTIVKVYDLIGREVARLVNEVKEPGTYTVQFDASNLASGVYFYRLQAGEFLATKRLLLLK